MGYQPQPMIISQCKDILHCCFLEKKIQKSNASTLCFNLTDKYQFSFLMDIIYYSSKTTAMVNFYFLQSDERSFILYVISVFLYLVSMYKNKTPDKPILEVWLL